jgi:ferredoxin--NADP+ reductase
MTQKELGELGHLERAAPRVDPADLPPESEDAALEPGQRKSVGHLRAFAQAGETKAVTIDFDFFARPVAVEGDGKVERLIVERTRLGADGAAEGTGETYAIPCGLIVSCIGYRTSPIAGVPFDERLGRFANTDGRIGPGLYVVGWARRGPTGTIGTNRPDGLDIAEAIAADNPAPQGKAGRAGLDALLAGRGVEVVTFRDWQKIEAAEAARARDGSPREKFVDLAEMLAARDR